MLEFFIDIILLITGFLLLILGANNFVDGAKNIATKMGVSKMLIGLTIVAFGGSTPELAVSFKSILSGNGDMLIGNIVGSNIINILLIIGLCSLVHFLNVKNVTVKRELPTLLIMTLAFTVLSLDRIFTKNSVNSLTRGDGIILLSFFLIFIYYLLKMSRDKMETSKDSTIKLSKSIFITIFGIISILVGSNLVVDNASDIALYLGLNKRIIGLTVVALGTSLPELVTSLIATKKGEHEIALGNVIGSNIFNIGIVAGLPISLLGGISNLNIRYIDLVILMISTILLCLFSRRNYKINKWEGLILLTIFILYYVSIFII